MQQGAQAATTAVQKGRERVGLHSSHPLFLQEFGRLLTEAGFDVDELRTDADENTVRIAADFFVVDAAAQQPAAESRVARLVISDPDKPILVILDSLDEANVFPFLELGVKGVLSYGEAKDQLAQAIQAMASGGYWVPRAILSGFLNLILGHRGLKSVQRSVAVKPSRREQEILDGLLANLSNKEIASNLHISERTVKFHVSNLLSKFHVQRRADLILLFYQRTTTDK